MPDIEKTDLDNHTNQSPPLKPWVDPQFIVIDVIGQTKGGTTLDKESTLGGIFS